MKRIKLKPTIKDKTLSLINPEKKQEHNKMTANSDK